MSLQDKIVKDINKLTPESIGKNVVTPSDLSDLIFSPNIYKVYISHEL